VVIKKAFCLAFTVGTHLCGLYRSRCTILYIGGWVQLGTCPAINSDILYGNINYGSILVLGKAILGVLDRLKVKIGPLLGLIIMAPARCWLRRCIFALTLIMKISSWGW